MGVEKLIGAFIKRTVKSTVNVELAIDPLIKQLQKSCPDVDTIKKIIAQKNSLSQALTQTQTTLTQISNIGDQTLLGLQILDTSILIIKNIPIPTSVPPGIGIPANVIIKFGDTLEKLKLLVKAGKGTVSALVPTINIINNSLSKILDKLNTLEGLITKCLIEKTLTMSDEEKEAFFEELGIDLNAPTTQQQASTGVTLEDQLNPNSSNPLLYKGFQLILDNDKENKFSFPRRRVIAIRKADNYNIQGNYSFSANTQILIDEVKFKIDQLKPVALQT